MKYRFVSLLVTASVICSFFISCELREFIANGLTPTVNCPIRMLINAPGFDSVEYSCGEYTFQVFNGHDRPHTFQKTSYGFPSGKSGFVVEIWRSLSSEEGASLRLGLSLREEGEFETGKKYSLVKNDSFDNTKIYFSIDGVDYNYYATEGWIVFTEFRDKEYLSGEFEFTALDKNSGNVMEVTNGTFENLLVL